MSWSNILRSSTGNRALRIFIYCSASLFIVVVLAIVIGFVPTENRWGQEGLNSMLAVAGICLSSALLAAIPMAVVAPRWPDQIGQAILAGTVIRLLLTMFGCVVYQALARPQLGSFLFWATIIYLAMLVTETPFGVWAIRKFYRVKQPNHPGTHA